MLEEAHLSNLKTKHADAEKVATVKTIFLFGQIIKLFFNRLKKC